MPASRMEGAQLRSGSGDVGKGHSMGERLPPPSPQPELCLGLPAGGSSQGMGGRETQAQDSCSGF